MPLYKLLHLTRSEPSQDSAYFDASMGTVDKAVAAGLYEHVATLNCADLAQLFRLTNSIDVAWFENPAAGALKTPLRSTSIGDIVYTEDGAFLSCQVVGWQDIPDTQTGPLIDALEDVDHVS